jgi:hypothetical protein
VTPIERFRGVLLDMRAQPIGRWYECEIIDGGVQYKTVNNVVEEWYWTLCQVEADLNSALGKMIEAIQNGGDLDDLT